MPYKIANYKIGCVSWFKGFICQFNQASEPHSQLITSVIVFNLVKDVLYLSQV